MEYRRKNISLIVPYRNNQLADTGSRNITILRTSDINELINAIRSIPKDPEELLDIEGVRLLLGGGGGKKVSKTTVNNWRKAGIIVPIKIGTGRNAAVRYRRQDVLDAIRMAEVKHPNKIRK